MEKLRTKMCAQEPQRFIKFSVIQGQEALVDDRVYLIQGVRTCVSASLVYKLDLYNQHLLYQQQKARQSPRDYKQYLALLAGKVLMHARIGAMEAVF